MCKLSKHTIGAIAITLLLVLCIGYHFFQYNYINCCLENWYGNNFVRYTGQCTSVSYNNGINLFNRYTFGLFTDDGQFLTGQGWHLSFESGDSYYIPMPLFRDQLPIQSLEGKKVSICCLPPTALFHCNLIVSLDHEDDEFLNDTDSYFYLQNANQRKFSTVLCVFCPIALILAVITGILIWLDIADFRQKKNNAQLKQERMNRLREEGKLHPKKQLQKKSQPGSSQPVSPKTD